MQSEVSHAAAEAWVWSSGFSGQLFFGDGGEFVGERSAVCHWGPAFFGPILEERDGVVWFWRRGCFDADGHGHSSDRGREMYRSNVVVEVLSDQT